jgi:1,4-alpha-glucan branching enzyme
LEISTLSDFDLYLYHQGTNYHAYKMLGAHPFVQDEVAGVRFSVWAPHAKSVSVVGDFNDWDAQRNPMVKVSDGEIWTTFLPALKQGDIYKYSIEPNGGGQRILKADPYGFFAEKKPQTASMVCDISGYAWQDEAWQLTKKQQASYGKPMLIYEVHFGSWRRNAAGEYLTYREAAVQLLDYVKEMSYTHIEFMPLCEHPFDGSWGYQATGYYAVTSRYGSPDDLRYLIDRAHQMGIGIIMDWVPGHFCKDEQGLSHFDGVNLYESDNEQRAENWEWGTTNFDYGRTEVRSFLISNAMFWFEEYHIDGLRIDAVANMLYLNYAREDGDWVPNKYGDSGNLEAMDFLRNLNETIFKYHPDALMIAEESTSWPLISKPVYMGGMGFNYKWNMGWMNDMLDYIALEPPYRKYNHDKITFSLMYAFSENFVLPLSHDEVVHAKHSLIEKMPGDYWQKFAGLRAFYGYWMAHPGKKLLFMGSEFAQFIEWNFDDSLDWHLIEGYPMHQKMQEYSKNLNKFYVEHKAFWEIDFEWDGFAWIDCNDNSNSVVSFIRKAEDEDDFIIVVCNFTPEVHYNYRIGLPENGIYNEVFNSDAAEFGGSGVKNSGDLVAEDISWQERSHSLALTVPPLATIYLRLKSQKKTDHKKTAIKGINESEKGLTSEKKAAQNSDKIEVEVKKSRTKKAVVKKTATVTSADIEDEADVKPKKTVRRKPAEKIETEKKTKALAKNKVNSAKNATSKTQKILIDEPTKADVKKIVKPRKPRVKKETVSKAEETKIKVK